MLGKTPSKKAIAAAKIALQAGTDVQWDKDTALKIYRDFKWKVQISDRTWPAIEAIIDLMIVRCQTELKSDKIRTEVVQRFNEMRNRASEFNVDEA